MPELDVLVEHFLDAGEQDADGYWDYYYEGDNFVLRANGTAPQARTYVDEPGRVSFIASLNQCSAFPGLAAAVEYFRARGVQHFFALGPSGGYESLDVEALGLR